MQLTLTDKYKNINTNRFVNLDNVEVTDRFYNNSNVNLYTLTLNYNCEPNVLYDVNQNVSYSVDNFEITLTDFNTEGLHNVQIITGNLDRLAWDFKWSTEKHVLATYNGDKRIITLPANESKNGIAWCEYIVNQINEIWGLSCGWYQNNLSRGFITNPPSGLSVNDIDTGFVWYNNTFVIGTTANKNVYNYVVNSFDNSPIYFYNTNLSTSYVIRISIDDNCTAKIVRNSTSI